MRLGLAILQPITLVILQHAVVAAEMALAEGAVPHDALRGGFAVFEGAFGFGFLLVGGLRGRYHGVAACAVGAAAEDGLGEVQGGGAGDGEGREG